MLSPDLQRIKHIHIKKNRHMAVFSYWSKACLKAREVRFTRVGTLRFTSSELHIDGVARTKRKRLAGLICKRTNLWLMFIS